MKKAAKMHVLILAFLLRTSLPHGQSYNAEGIDLKTCKNS